MKEIPLYSEDWEKALIWDLINSPEYLLDLSLSVDDFFLSETKAIFKILKTLEAKDINIISIKNELEKTNQLEKIGGMTFLISLLDYWYWSIKSYENIIKEFSNKRKLKALIEQTHSKLQTENWNDLFNWLYDWLSSIEKNISSSEEDLFTLLWDTLDYIEQIKTLDLIWYSFGSQFKWLDKLTGWIQRGKVFRIGWPSNVWKSWLLYNFLMSLLNQTDAVTFFSLENSKVDILKNFFWLKRGVNTLPAFIKEHNYDFEKEALWFQSKERFNISNEKNLDNIARIALKNKSEFIFIDYVQLLQLSWPFKSDVAKAEGIAIKLQDIASKYNIGIIDLSQVSNSTKRGWTDWEGSDELKGASAYKETSDVVLHISSDVNKEEAKQSAIANGERDKMFLTYNKIKVTKNRLWPGVGSVKDFSLDFNLWGKYILESFS